MVSIVRAENTIRPEAPQPAPPERESEAHRTRVVLSIAFLVAIAIRIALAWFSGSAQPQEIRYITIARGIISGQGYHGLDNRFPDIIQPPLYPMLLAAALVLPGPDLAVARGLSILMGALLIFPCAAIARKLFGWKTARRAACLAAVYPLLADMSSAAITESTFGLLVILAALTIWRALDSNDRGSVLPPSLLAGILLGLSFLTRPEGLTYLAVAWLVCLFDAVWRKGSLRPIVRSAIGFAVVVLPYLVWVHSQTGQWLLAPKAILVRVHQTLMQEGQREGWREPYGSVLFFEHVKFGLNKDATAIRSHEEFAAAGAGLAEGLLVSDDEEVSVLSPLMALRMILRNFSELYLETIKYGFVIPSLLVMMAGIGLVSRPWVGEFRRAAFIVLVFLLGSFTFLVSHVEPRFLYAAMPFLIPWIAEGWLRTEAWATATLSGANPARVTARMRIVRAMAGTLVMGLTVAHLPPAVRITSNLWAEHRELGSWIHAEIGPGRKVMAATAVVAFYADAAFEVLPYADLTSTVDYARRKGVEYLVADRAEIPTFRPQLTSLLIVDRPHPGLELVKALHEGSSHAIFLYRVSSMSESAR